MSKVKSPTEKKIKSLLKDRRNTYGESPTSSRKNIRRGKQRSHKALRRAVAEELRTVRGACGMVDSDLVEERAKVRLVERKRASFKKLPDTPLAVVLNRKLKKRQQQREHETVMVSYAKFLEQLRAEKRLLRALGRKQPK